MFGKPKTTTEPLGDQLDSLLSKSRLSAGSISNLLQGRADEYARRAGINLSLSTTQRTAVLAMSKAEGDQATEEWEREQQEAAE